MELYYLIVITIIAIGCLTAIYFIVNRFTAAIIANTEANQETVKRLTNMLAADTATDFNLLNEADKPKTKKPEPLADSRFVAPEDMSAEDYEKVI